MSDEVLKQDILDELEFEPRVDAGKIRVSVRDGIVTIVGHVGSLAEKVAVQNAVMRVKGLRGVAEEIDVRPAGAESLHDDEIARRVSDVLRWSTLIPYGRLVVEVDHGAVTLTGKLDWALSRLRLLRADEPRHGAAALRHEYRRPLSSTCSQISEGGVGLFERICRDRYVQPLRCSALEKQPAIFSCEIGH